MKWLWNSTVSSKSNSFLKCLNFNFEKFKCLLIFARFVGGLPAVARTASWNCTCAARKWSTPTTSTTPICAETTQRPSSGPKVRAWSWSSAAARHKAADLKPNISSSQVSGYDKVPPISWVIQCVKQTIRQSRYNFSQVKLKSGRCHWFERECQHSGVNTLITFKSSCTFGVVRAHVAIMRNADLLTVESCKEVETSLEFFESSAQTQVVSVVFPCNLSAIQMSRCFDVSRIVIRMLWLEEM